jgi:Fibronectin type III domain
MAFGRQTFLRLALVAALPAICAVAWLSSGRGLLSASALLAMPATPTPAPTVTPTICPSGMTATFVGYCTGPTNAPSATVNAATNSNTGVAVYQPTQQCGAELIPASIACVILPASPAVASTAVNAPSDAPSQVVATALDATEIRVDWAYSGTNVQSFVLLDADNGQTVLGNAAATARTFTLTRLSPATQYCVAVYAYNAAGYSPASAVVCATTPAD